MKALSVQCFVLQKCLCKKLYVCVLDPCASVYFACSCLTHPGCAFFTLKSGWGKAHKIFTVQAQQTASMLYESSSSTTMCGVIKSDSRLLLCFTYLNANKITWCHEQLNCFETSVNCDLLKSNILLVISLSLSFLFRCSNGAAIISCNFLLASYSHLVHT